MPEGGTMMTMDLWYDLAMREPASLNEAAAALLREAEEVSLAPEEAEEGDE
jgi:hypothetical protein